MSSIILKSFTEQDWLGHAGAERFPSGEEPLIAHRSTGVLIVDANGVTFITNTDLSSDADTSVEYTLDVAFTSADHANTFMKDTFDISTRIDVQVNCEHPGDSWATGMNATLAEARAYFIGHRFEGRSKVISVELMK